VYVKVKLFLCLFKDNVMRTWRHMSRESFTSGILKLCVRWMSVVSLTIGSICSRRKKLLFPLHRWPQNQSGYGERKYSCRSVESNPCCPAFSEVIYWLSKSLCLLPKTAVNSLWLTSMWCCVTHAILIENEMWYFNKMMPRPTSGWFECTPECFLIRSLGG
jgi:hypothetical protein